MRDHAQMASPLARFNGFLPLLLGILVVATFAGCGSTTAHRIRQYPDAFQALPAAEQQRILASRIQVGDSPLHVYLALGPPNRSDRFVLPEVRPGDTWSYLGHFGEDGVSFSSSYAFNGPSFRPPVMLNITFGPERKVASIKTVP